MSKDEVESHLAILGFTNFQSRTADTNCYVQCTIPNAISLVTIGGYSTDAIRDYRVVHSYSGRQLEDVYEEFIDYAILVKQNVRQV